ncbi:MAG: hypothetical protein ABIF10_07520 [Candidatus Woesearchaeota archaeon]
MGIIPKTAKAIIKHQGWINRAKEYSEKTYPRVMKACDVALSVAKSAGLESVVIRCPRRKGIEAYDLMSEVFGEQYVPKDYSPYLFFQAIGYSQDKAPILISLGFAGPRLPFVPYRRFLELSSQIELPPKFSVGFNKLYDSQGNVIPPAFRKFLDNYRMQHFTTSNVVGLALEYVESVKKSSST